MTIAICGVCNIEMIPLDDIDEKYKCPKCGRIVDWSIGPTLKEIKNMITGDRLKN